MQCINCLIKVSSSAPQCSDIWFVSVLGKHSNKHFLNTLLYKESFWYRKGMVLTTLGYHLTWWINNHICAQHKGGCTYMIHNVRSMVGGSRTQVGRRQAWLLGTTGISAGIHLQTQQQKNKTTQAVIVHVVLGAVLCVRDNKISCKWNIDILKKH